MRRALALAAAFALTAGAALAEPWTKYADGDNGTQWSYDSAYTYKDKQSGRLMVMKSISQPAKNIAPGGPGKGVGYVEAIDCKKKDAISLGLYTPNKELAVNEGWRKDKTKPADAALVAAVCPHLDHVPVK